MPALLSKAAGQKRREFLAAKRHKRHRHSQSQITQLTRQKVAGALTKILSAEQKETEMTVTFERHQMINTSKIPL
jgi:hypothetical protein